MGSGTSTSSPLLNRHSDVANKPFCARHQRHVVGADLDAQQAALLGADGLTQGRAAEDVGVVGVALLQGGTGGSADALVGGEVRVTDAEHDHVFAAPTGLDGRVVDVPGADGFAADALYER